MADPNFAAIPDANAVYAPLEQNLKNQAAANENRYAQNKADVASITGVLTSVAPLDRQRINDQFASSIQQQQEQVAARTAEARQQQKAGNAGAQSAASELGSGGMPAPTDSWSNAAINQGIGQSNAALTNWTGFMNTMNQQQVGNVDARQAGYGFQVANALQQLNRQHQADILGQQTAWNDLQSQKAQGAISAGIKQAEMGQESALANAKNQTALGVAQLRAQGTMGAAATSAAATRYAADTRAATSLAKSAKPSNIKLDSPVAWEKMVRQSNVSFVPGQSVGAGLTLAKRNVAAIRDALQVAADAQAANTGKTKGKVTWNDVYNGWLKVNPNASGPMRDSMYKAIKAGYYTTWSPTK